MVRALTPKLALGLLFTGGASGFVPFADVEELKPQRLDAFCSKEVLPGQKGIRSCSHAVKKRLLDGGDVELGWQMNVDPSSILSLDTEAERGVRLTRCAPDELELELPESHVLHAAEGKFIVASRFAHSCEHLPENHLYHRVLGVKRHEWREAAAGAVGGKPRARTAYVHLATEELPSFAHIVPHISFQFSYTPVEARDLRPFPRMRTDYGLNRNFMNNPRARRLSLLPFGLGDKFKKLQKLKLKGLDKDNGGFQSGGQTSGLPTIKTQNSILNLQPKQVSNFGWNWDFAMNSTTEPNINISGPGAKGVFKIRKPYIKVHAGIYLNFTSDFNGALGFMKAPKVQWTAGIQGHGTVQARVLSLLNTTSSAGVDPFSFSQLGLDKLEKLKTPLWFEKVDFATGTLPFSFEPGFQFNAKLYHSGAFHGAIAVGGRTNGVFNTSLSFDSLAGFDTHFTGVLTDTDVWPPLWMIFTKRFELGLMLEPSILMRGDFAGLEKATATIELRPYFNVTVRREGAEAESSADMKTLTVYPIRVMGINNNDFSTKYKVKILALENTLATSTEINWGEVKFHDHVSEFDCGSVPQSAVINQPITITLIQVDAAGTEVPLGQGDVVCTSLLNGECNPSPGIALIKSSMGATIASVELAIIWENSPDPWFASKIRGVGISFPQVVLRTDVLKSTFPNALAAAQANKPLSLHLDYGSRTYVMGINGNPTSQQDVLSADTTVEFGPTFLETWMPCTTANTKCQSPSLSIYYGTTQVAVATIPQIEWTSQTAMQGTRQSGIASASSQMIVPATVALYDAISKESIIAVVKMNANVVSPREASLFLSPSSGTLVAISSSKKFVWLVSNVDETEEYTFTLTSLKVATVPSTATYLNYSKVGDMALMQIPGAQATAKIKCTRTGIAGMAASEAPCSFSHTFTFGHGYTAGDQVVMLVSWQGDSTTHVLYSPPFEIVAKAPTRRLSSRDAGPLVPLPRRLWSKEKWNSRVESHANCANKDLHFNMGAGMLVRGKIGSVKMPKNFPMLGGLAEQPELTSKWRKIASVKPGADGEDILPPALCAGGLCSGALPGCTGVGANFKKMHFPKLVFNFNRPFHYRVNRTGKFKGAMKQVLAYAFATLPEMVDVMIKELNTPDTLPTEAPSSSVDQRGHPAQPQYPGGQLQGTQYPQTLPAQTTTTVGVFNRWWSGAARRLEEDNEEDEEAAWAHRPAHQVAMQFKEGVPFVVDRPLVEMMMQHGYFMEVDDDASQSEGPLAITDFYVDSGPGVVAEDDTENSGVAAPWYLKAHGAKAKPKPMDVTPHSQGLLILASVVGGTCLAAVVAVMQRKTVRPEVGMAELEEADGME
mmetsp:Transcript_52995/g.113709  ORF Transcript_52995/g.113709 Transcript_52995/m.113709 type:complete len:1344 (-) Transcript_52995:170-4201(-)